MLLPLYLFWAGAALLVRRRAGVVHASVFCVATALYVCMLLVIIEPTYAAAAPVPAAWYFGLSGDLLADVSSLFPALEPSWIATQEAWLVELYATLPARVVGAAPFFGLLIQHRWQRPRDRIAASVWIHRPLRLLMLGLLGASLLHTSTDGAPATMLVYALPGLDVFAGLTTRVATTLGLALSVHAGATARTFFVLLPFAALGRRALLPALLLAAVLGPAAEAVLLAIGVALALLGWIEPAKAPGAGATVHPLPRAMGAGYRQASFRVAAALVLLGFFGYSFPEPGAEPLLPAGLRTPLGPDTCRADPGGVRRFPTFEIDCAESDFATGTVGGLDAHEAQAHCTSKEMRLCTEREWRAACQGPGGNLYPSSEEFDTAAFACPILWGIALPPAMPTICVSSAGLYGMLGSHMEWVRIDDGGFGLKGNAIGPSGVADPVRLHHAHPLPGAP